MENKNETMDEIQVNEIEKEEQRSQLTIKEKIIIKEVPVEKIVEKVIEKEVEVEKIVEVPVEVIKEQELVTFNKSEDISELLKSLVQFHTELKSIDKNIENGFFKNKYADLSSILKEIRPLLSKNKLILMQFPMKTKDGAVSIKTILTHESGQFIENDYIPVKPQKLSSQDVGAIQTYARRYSISAILAISFDEDDDGNSVSVNQPSQQTESAKTTTRGTSLRGSRL